MRKLLLCMMITTIVGCGSEEMKHFPISIILTGPLQGFKAEDPLPSYIMKFIQPIECEKTAFIPDVTILRTDVKDTMTIIIDSKWQNKLKKTGDTYDYDALKDDYSEYVPKLKVGDYLVKTGTIQGINNSISKPSDALIFNLTKGDKNQTDSIITSISDMLCKKNDLRKVIVQLNLISDVPYKDAMSPGQIDSFTNQLSDANGDTVALKKISQEIKTYNANSDFNVEYLLAIKTIFGKRHILAFQHLMNAARVAIRTNKSVTMLGYFERDSNDKTKLWKLANGHKDIWGAINQSLENKNPVILDKIDLAGEAAEHHESLVEHD